MSELMTSTIYKNLKRQLLVVLRDTDTRLMNDIIKRTTFDNGTCALLGSDRASGRVGPQPRPLIHSSTAIGARVQYTSPGGSSRQWRLRHAGMSLSLCSESQIPTAVSFSSSPGTGAASAAAQSDGHAGTGSSGGMNLRQRAPKSRHSSVRGSAPRLATRGKRISAGTWITSTDADSRDGTLSAARSGSAPTVSAPAGSPRSAQPTSTRVAPGSRIFASSRLWCTPGRSCTPCRWRIVLQKSG
mmetsp:Transcript_25173/g.65042  ORF Transcript_25173/g.65042 Transcript_25173/m.65042 type:complete len:243 (+) Transcript_25173:3-731(+)